MHIEIPAQYLEALLLCCADLEISLEELLEIMIIHYMERTKNNE